MLNVTHYQRNANQNHNEVPSYARSEWLLSKNLQTITAAEGWRKGNPLALLFGMQIDITTMENSMEISLKNKNRAAL